MSGFSEVKQKTKMKNEKREMKNEKRKMKNEKCETKNEKQKRKKKKQKKKIVDISKIQFFLKTYFKLFISLALIHFVLNLKK